jgi:hypothetical protein
MTQARPAPVTLAEFDEIFEAVKNWGRWGPDDNLGTLTTSPRTRCGPRPEPSGPGGV